MQPDASILRPLLAYLVQSPPTTATTWQAWSVAPIAGGANNLLYRTTSDHGDFAVKFTIRDQRDRAGREYRALSALAQAGLTIAPHPMLLDQTHYRLPVVVQTWLTGNTLSLPTSDDDWQAILHHFATIHAVTPQTTGLVLQPTVLNAQNIEGCRKLVREQLNFIPLSSHPRALRRLIQRFDHVLPPDWPPPPLRLCRVDPNLSNFIGQPAGVVSVDWENSGWGDPAFEIADLMAHPAYSAIPASRWPDVIDTYCAMVQEPTAATRIAVYYKTMLVWWVARFARMLYEVPQGLDQRLVARPHGWQHDIRTKYEDYMAVAATHL